MANVKISQLPSLTTMTDTAEIPVVSAGVTYQITGANLTNYFGGSNTFSSITMTDTPSGAANNIQYGLGNLVSYLDGGWTIGEYNGEFYGTEGIRINPGIEGSADIVLPADAANIPVQVNNYSGNVQIQTGEGFNWTFDSDGQINIPANSNSFGTGRIQSANGYPTLLAYGSGEEHGGPELDWMNTNDPANAFGNSTVLRNTMYINDGGLYVGMNENGVANVASPNWRLAPNGGTVFPTLATQRGDNPSGTISGQTLLFGDNGQEAVISTPDGVAGNEYSQRLVINPGQGYDFGEGGDIYLWAGRGGDGSGSGGDIKIRGGQGGANTTGGSGGSGGYIRIEAGDANAVGGGAAGYIDITGGFSNVAGGYVRIQGGGGNAGGGDANITGGYGYGGPGGNVNIIGGSSALGAGNFGNVTINTGNAGNTWAFSENGNLTITHGSQIQEVASPVAGNYALALRGTGSVSPDQQLLIYPTSLDANHLHLTSGNLYNTELFLGNDNLYVKLANTGNVVINADDSTGNSFQYIFGADTTITMPGSGLRIDSGYNSGNAGFVAGSGVSVGLTELYTSGNIAAQIVLNRPQIDHSIQLSLYPDSASPATTWTFDDTGDLTTPGSGGDITMTGGNITGAGKVVTTPVALSSLTAVAGARAFVNNGNLVAAGNFGAQIDGGGSNTVPVWSDGTNWYIG